MKNSELITPNTIELQMEDAVKTAINIYAPKNALTSTSLLVIFPALGVKGDYYTSLASDFAANGMIAVTTDWRGNGHSSIRPSRQVDFGFKEFLQDYQIIFEEVRKYFPQQPLYVLGHSLGGQLASMFLATHQYGQQGLILVASGSPYYKGWSGVERWGLLFLTQLARFIATTLGYFPGRSLGFGGLESKGVIKDWSRVAKTGKYRAEGNAADYEVALSQLDLPALVLSFEGDKMSIPQSNKNLYAKFKTESKAITTIHLAKNDPRNEGFDHFNWVKKSQNIVAMVKEWQKGIVRKKREGR